MPVRDVRIDQRQQWARQHWRTITAAYGNSPFFEFYKDELILFFEAPPPFLFDWNLQLVDWLFSQLPFDTNRQLSTEYNPNPTDILDFRRQISPKLNQASTKPYAQVFQDRFGFQADLSVLDLLFCQGPEAQKYL